MNKKKSATRESPHAYYKNVADETVKLQIFDIIAKTPATSQKKITEQTGLTASLVHSFMRHIISKGWIRVKKVNTKRWLYFLTPDGFMEKSRISVNYLSRTFNTYRVAQNLVRAELENCARDSRWKIVVAGISELAEIAALNIKAAGGFILAGVVADVLHEKMFAGEKILPLSAINNLEYDSLWVCDANFDRWLGESKQDVDQNCLVCLVDMIKTFP